MKIFWKHFYLRKYFLVFILVSFANLASSQDFNNYINIKPSGVIPEDFLTLSSSKFEADKATISKKESNFIKRTQKQFYLESNFMINELLLNGKVLFNDPLTLYVNKVLAELLVNQPELKKKIRIYVVLSPIVNAYATDNGTIFINVGLLSKLETEAQLAFVLGHEITHFDKKHVLNRYVHNEKIVKGKITYSGSEIESQLFSQTSYAKEQEMEADLNAVSIISNTKYTPESGLRVMELLDSELPFEEKAGFNPDFFKFQKEIFFDFKEVNKDSIAIEKVDEKENVSHPAISERISKIKAKITSSDSLKMDFVSPQSDFFLMRKIARFELSKLYLLKGKNNHALYSAYQLLFDNPESSYLKEIVCKALYISAKFPLQKEPSNINEYITYESKEVQYIHQLINQLSPAERNSLAIMGYLQYYPHPSKLSEEPRFKDLLMDYKNNYSSDTSAYVYKVRNYLNQNPTSKSILESVVASPKEEPISTSSSRKNKAGIDKIIVLDPKYKKFDLRKERQIQYIASEKSLIEYHDQLESTSKILSIQSSIISPLKLNPDDFQKFYEHSILKNYMEEVFNNGSEIIPTDYEKVRQICKEYNSEHVALVGTYSFHLQKPLILKIGVLVWTGVVFPTLPFGIYYASVPSYKTYNYLLVINTKNQMLDYKDIQVMKFRDSKGAVNSSIYYQLQTMRGKKR
jgi:Zn-dependent protease with chaperone function